MHVAHLSEILTLVECPLLPGDTDTVRAALVAGQRHRVVVDTLCSPGDMRPFADPTLVVYTHADWDHCWGTAAFPGIPVIAHRAARERLQDAREAEELAQMCSQYPERFEGARLVVPEITFDSQLEVDAGGVTLRLEHVPGHTLDSIWVYLPELEVLLAGDAAEDPFPSLGVPGSLRGWARRLRQRSAQGVKQVVPAHGRVLGPGLLEQNADYIEWLLEEGKAGLENGMSLPEIQDALPVERFWKDAGQLSAYYRTTHRQNVAVAVAELQHEKK